MNVCCFPDLQQAGMPISPPGPALAQDSREAKPVLRGGAKGNFQTNTDWHNYKAGGLPYHGEFFIDPDSGIVVRMITQAELKPSEVVHLEDTRIDYAPETVGDKTLVLPMRTMINTEVVPNGDLRRGKVFDPLHALHGGVQGLPDRQGAAHRNRPATAMETWSASTR